MIAKGKPAPRPQKTFKPKFDLPVLDCYRGSAGPDFWAKFPVNRRRRAISLINPVALERLGRQLDLVDAKFEQALHDITHGASIGCRGDARLPSRSTNAPSAYEFGRHVSDALAAWIDQGFVMGPFEESQVPAGAKISGIMVKLKPTGAVRVILNLSAPEGFCVNEGIDKEDFPAYMSSITLWLIALHRGGGRGVLMVKIDWSDAYKHIPVCRADLDLQWFSWLGKYFAELCLIFGGASSAGIYDRDAKVILEIVIKLSGIPRSQVCQHLDDTCAAASPESGLAEKFDEAYQGVAREVGVKLAPRDNPEKSFGPSTRGVVFGVEFDTVAWTWAIPGDRLNAIVLLVFEVLDMAFIPAKLFESLTGKLVNIKPLVPNSRFHMSELQKGVGSIRRGAKSVKMTPLLEDQLHFWRVILPACSGKMAIPDPFAGIPPWSVGFYTDASGGSLNSRGHGLGAVGPNWWSYMAWPASVNRGKRDAEGRTLTKKLSWFEILGPLLVLAAAPELCAGREIRVWVDNKGAVDIYEKGYSPRCDLCTCVARAINVVAGRLACRVAVAKITRCSTVGAVLADTLSKADFHGFLRRWEGPLPEGARAPLVLLRWVNDPDPFFPLGDAILRALNL